MKSKQVKNTKTIVKLPEMNYEGMAADEALLKFYIDLGWEPKTQSLNPKKVKISECDYKTLIERINSSDHDGSMGINFLMLNKGPSCGYETVKEGTVQLLKGWAVAS